MNADSIRYVGLIPNDADIENGTGVVNGFNLSNFPPSVRVVLRGKRPDL
jgi:hypothetical protein